MNISSNEESSLDVTVDYDIYGQMYHITFILNHDKSGISKIQYSLPDIDMEYLISNMEYLIEYLQAKVK